MPYATTVAYLSHAFSLRTHEVTDLKPHAFRKTVDPIGQTAGMVIRTDHQRFGIVTA